ncbi:hypothetical protein [Deinococcus sp.]|uniref:hypothetical protein n=1 Tax=Deinococcus sp. TaxID=47478 RepID=UPI003CC6B2D0
MNNALKAVLGFSALTAVLTSCIGGTPDGSAGLAVTNLKTDYKDQSGRYVACDNALYSGTSSTQTTVATYLTVAGAISSVNVNLRGNTTSQYDANYTATFFPGDLSSTGASSYKATFYADAGTGGFLPQSLGRQSLASRASWSIPARPPTSRAWCRWAAAWDRSTRRSR